jgi:hypothetical protein
MLTIQPVGLTVRVRASVEFDCGQSTSYREQTTCPPAEVILAELVS